MSNNLPLADFMYVHAAAQKKAGCDPRYPWNNPDMLKKLDKIFNEYKERVKRNEHSDNC